MLRVYEVALMIVIIMIMFKYSGCCEQCATCGGKSKTTVTSAIESMRANLYSQRQLIYHYAPWCPQCDLMKVVWDALKVSAPQLLYKEVNEDIAKTPYVNRYPTIFLIDENGKRHQYMGPRDGTALLNWSLSPSFRD